MHDYGSCECPRTRTGYLKAELAEFFRDGLHSRHWLLLRPHRSIGTVDFPIRYYDLFLRWNRRHQDHHIRLPWIRRRTVPMTVGAELS